MKVTLEQWRCLISVVDEGGYAQAAEFLHKSQSAVTYAVQKMERVLGVPIFSIDGRKAQLTKEGETLYRRAKNLIADAADIERAAQKQAQGWETELRIAVDTVFPTGIMLCALQQFSEKSGTPRVEFYESVLGGTDELLLQGRVDMALCTYVPAGFIGEFLMPVEFVAVAHPQHPLHQLERPLTQMDLRQHRQLVIRDSGSKRERNSGWQGSEQRWTVGHKTTSIRAACAGLGFAWYARSWIETELGNGELKVLPMATGSARYANVFTVFADQDQPGRSVRLFDQCIRQELQKAADKIKA